MCAMQIVLQTRNVATIDRLVSGVITLTYQVGAVQYGCG